VTQANTDPRTRYLSTPRKGYQEQYRYDRASNAAGNTSHTQPSSKHSTPSKTNQATYQDATPSKYPTKTPYNTPGPYAIGAEMAALQYPSASATHGNIPIIFEPAEGIERPEEMEG